MTALTSREKFDRLRAALRASRESKQQELATKLDACGQDWDTRYRCRSPACPRCRRANIAQQQRYVRDFYAAVPNEQLALVSVVLPGTRDVDDIPAILKQGHEGLRKRVAAARSRSSGWDDVCVNGWFEIDALGAHQVPHLPPERKALLANLAPMSFDQSGPMWVPSFHAICYTGPLHTGEVREALAQQWKLPNQAHIRPFDLAKPVEQNLDIVTAYPGKFSCETTLQDRFVDPWPVSWQAALFTWMNRPRNAFEFLSFTVGQKAEPKIIINTPVPVEVEPMPFSHSFSRVPMYNKLGAYDAFPRF